MDNQDKKQKLESMPKRAVSRTPCNFEDLALEAFMDALGGSPGAAVRAEGAECRNAALDRAKNFMARLGPDLGQAVKDGNIQEDHAIGFVKQWLAYIFDPNADTYPPNFSDGDMERQDPEAWMFLGISPDGQHPYELLPNEIDERIRFVDEVSKTAEWLAFERAIGDAVGTRRPTLQIQETAQRKRKARSTPIEIRRGIVAGNLARGPKDICAEFDKARIPLPDHWTPFVQNWRQAERSGQYCQKVRQIISKDKDKVQKTTVKP